MMPDGEPHHSLETIWKARCTTAHLTKTREMTRRADEPPHPAMTKLLALWNIAYRSHYLSPPRVLLGFGCSSCCNIVLPWQAEGRVGLHLRGHLAETQQGEVGLEEKSCAWGVNLE